MAGGLVRSQEQASVKTEEDGSVTPCLVGAGEGRQEELWDGLKCVARVAGPRSKDT